MLKVLIIDDQPAVRTALETLFEVHDLPALSVASSDEALHLLATEKLAEIIQATPLARRGWDRIQPPK